MINGSNKKKISLSMSNFHERLRECADNNDEFTEFLNTLDKAGLEEAFFWAAKNNNNTLLNTLINNFIIKPAISDKDGINALMFAAESGHNNVVDNLINNHDASVADKDNQCRTAIMYATIGGKNDVLDNLINHGASIADKDNQGRTAIMYATIVGKNDVVDNLINHGARVADKDNQGWTALMFAAAKGNNKLVESLICVHGANIADKNNLGGNALMLAAEYGHNEIINNLINNHGARVADKDNLSRTALMHAAISGHNEVVNNLINNHGARVADKDQHGQTALMHAARYLRYEIMSNLISNHGANINHEDDRGYTVAMLSAHDSMRSWLQVLERLLPAIRNDNFERIKRLLDFERDVINGRPVESGWSIVLKTALERNDLDILTLLIEYGFIFEGADEFVMEDGQYNFYHALARLGHSQCIQAIYQNKNLIQQVVSHIDANRFQHRPYEDQDILLITNGLLSGHLQAGKGDVNIENIEPLNQPMTKASVASLKLAVLYIQRLSERCEEKMTLLARCVNELCGVDFQPNKPRTMDSIWLQLLDCAAPTAQEEHTQIYDETRSFTPSLNTDAKRQREEKTNNSADTKKSKSMVKRN